MLHLITLLRAGAMSRRITRRLDRNGNYARFQVGEMRAFHGSSSYESGYVCVTPEAQQIAGDPALFADLCALDREVQRHCNLTKAQRRQSAVAAKGA